MGEGKMIKICFMKMFSIKTMMVKTYMQIHIHMWILGTELSSSCIKGKYKEFTGRAIVPASRKRSLKLILSRF